MRLPAAEITVRIEAPPAPVPEPITKIEIDEQIQFATWKAEILPPSFGTLDEVAETLQAHRELTRIEIQGHTAEANRPERTQRLSEARAEAVRKYLIEKGVEPERLVAKGYGADRPVADNETADGRSRNRRVEFIVLERETGADQMAAAGGRQ